MYNLPPVLAHLVELIILVITGAIAVGVGLRVLNLVRVGLLLSVGERLVFGLALGYGILSFSLLAMGLLGIIYLPVGLGLLVVLALLDYGPLAGLVRELVPTLRQALVALRYPANLFLAVVIVLAVMAALAKALVPVATQDDLMYHLELPKRYIEQHAVAFHPDSTYSLFPQLMEMLYTWGLLLGSDRLAVLFALSAGLLGPAAIALYAKRYLGGDGQGVWRALPLLCTALFLTVPLVGYVLRAANTDLAQASFDSLAVYALYLAIVSVARDRSSTPTNPFIVLSGLCCGLSFSTKYYGFAVALAIGVALVTLFVFQQMRPGRGDNVRSRFNFATIPL